MVGILIRMKLRLLQHSLRGRHAAFIVIGAVVGLGAGLATVMVVAADFGDPEVSTDVAAALYAMWTMGWLFAPLITGGSDETLQPEHFRLLPIRPRQLATGFLVTSFVGVPAVAALIAFAGLAVRGGLFGVGPAVVGVLAALLQLALAVVLSRVVFAAFGAVLRSRRGRDLGVLLAASVGLLYYPMQLMVRALGPTLMEGRSPTLSALLRAAPSGWGVVAVDAAADENWLLALAALLGLVALVAVLLMAWSALLVRRMTTAPSGGSRSDRRNRRERVRRRELLSSGPVGAVAGKELRTWWRDARRRVVLLGALVVGLIVPMAVGFGQQRVTMLPFAAVWITFFACLQSGNLYGFDGSALWHTLVIPGAERHDVRGRQLAWLLVVAPVVLLAAFVIPGASGNPAAYPWVLGLVPALLGGGSGLVLLLSVFAAFPVPTQRGGNPFNTGARPGCARALLQFAMALLLAVAALPVLLVVGLGAGLDLPVLSWLGVPVGVASGVGLAWWWGGIAHRRLFARGPELVATVRGTT